MSTPVWILLAVLITTGAAAAAVLLVAVAQEALVALLRVIERRLNRRQSDQQLTNVQAIRPAYDRAADHRAGELLREIRSPNRRGPDASCASGPQRPAA